MNFLITKYILFSPAYLPIYLIVALKNINTQIFYSAAMLKPLGSISRINCFPVFLINLSLLQSTFFKIHQMRSLKTRGYPIFTIKEITTNKLHTWVQARCTGN